MTQAPPDTPPVHIDSTMMNCFRSCPQKYHREFIQGYRPPGISIDLHAGACFASATEEVRRQVYLHRRPLTEALIIAQARFFQEWGDVEPPDWKRTAKTKDRVWEAVESYFTHFSPLTDHVRPYTMADGAPALEYSFALPLEPISSTDNGVCFPSHPHGGPFLYSGRFDMVGEYQSQPCVLDDKTTGSSIGRNWAYQWDLRSQFLGYAWACQNDERFSSLNTVVIRGIAIQTTQIVFAEAIKLYPSALIAKWFEQLRRDLWRLVRCYEAGYWDYNFGDTCTSYGTCIFMPVCQSTNPETWLNEFQISHWNPVAKTPITLSDQRTTF